MSITEQTQAIPAEPAPPPPPPPAAAPRSRALPTTVGTGLALVGTVFALGGSALVAAVGTDGTYGTDTQELTTPTRALVSSATEVDGLNDVADEIGDPEVGIEASAREGQPDVFVGVGRSADVDRYLAGAQVDEVTDIEVGPFELNRERHEGKAKPRPPATQSFWVSQSQGRTANVDWKVRDGSYKFVVMNADGSRNVATDGHVELTAPILSWIAIGALVTGIAALLSGLALVVRSMSGRTRA